MTEKDNSRELWKVAVLGVGNMAQALVEGFSRANGGGILEGKNVPRLKFYFFNPSQTKAMEAAKKYSGEHLTDLKDLQQDHFNMIMLGCKPQQFNELAQELAPNLKGDEIIFSMMAALSTDVISKKLGVSKGKVIRIMPNTPNSVGFGANLIYFGQGIGLPEKVQVQALLDHFSLNYPVKEETMIDQLTFFTGCMPALVFEFVRLLQAQMILVGLDAKQAQDLLTQTFLGSSMLLKLSGKSAEQLRSEVTSKGGVTAEALKVLADYKLDQIFKEAELNALKRNQEISNLYKN